MTSAVDGNSWKKKSTGTLKLFFLVSLIDFYHNQFVFLPSHKLRRQMRENFCNTVHSTSTTSGLGEPPPSISFPGDNPVVGIPFLTASFAVGFFFFLDEKKNSIF